MDDRRDPATRFHARFSRVSWVFPGVVGLAYAGHLTDALDDSDETVLATVRDWEDQHGLAHRDWQAIGTGGTWHFLFFLITRHQSGASKHFVGQSQRCQLDGPDQVNNAVKP